MNSIGICKHHDVNSNTVINVVCMIEIIDD